jgi:G2/mitotic-specific cyclin 2
MNWLFMSARATFHVSARSYMLAVVLLDRYWEQRPLTQDTPAEVECVGGAALMLASKLEEYFPLQPSQLAEHLTNTSATAIEARELDMLLTLRFHVHAYTPLFFLGRLYDTIASAAASAADRTVWLIEYIALVSSASHVMLQFAPSHIAAAATYIGRAMMSRARPWTPAFVAATHLELDDIALCVFRLNELLVRQSSTTNNTTLKLCRFRTVYERASCLAVATIPCISVLPHEFVAREHDRKRRRVTDSSEEGMTSSGDDNDAPSS